jgi:hypothetical protein
MIDPEDLESRARIAEDTRKIIRHTARGWYWCDRGDQHTTFGPFDTYYEALSDAVKPDPDFTALPWQVWPLADDRTTYGDNAGRCIIVTQDGEHEVPGHGFYDVAEAERVVDAHNATLVDCARYRCPVTGPSSRMLAHEDHPDVWFCSDDCRDEHAQATWERQQEMRG